MDSLSSLALATELPTKHIIEDMPVHRSAWMINPCMLRNIVTVGVYECVIGLLMTFGKVGDAFTLVPDALKEEG